MADEIIVQIIGGDQVISVDVTDPEPPILVTVAELGLVGPQGPQGATGPAGGATFTYHQTSPAATWTVDHNLGRYAVPVLILDDEPERPVVSDYDTPSINRTVITLPAPATGFAYF